MNKKKSKYLVIDLMIRNDEKEQPIDEWQISKVIIDKLLII